MRLVVASALAVFLGLLWASPLAAQPEEEPRPQIGDIVGRGGTICYPGAECRPARFADVISAGTRIQTTSGSLFIIDRTGHRPRTIVVGPNTDIRFDIVPDLVAPDKTLVELIGGFLRFTLDPGGGWDRIIFQDPGSETGCGATGTDLVFGRDPDDEATTIAVGEGSVVCENPAGDVRQVGAMERLDIGADEMGPVVTMSEAEWDDLLASVTQRRGPLTPSPGPIASIGFEGAWSWGSFGTRLELTRAGSSVDGPYGPRDDLGRDRRRVEMDVTGERSLEGFWMKDSPSQVTCKTPRGGSDYWGRLRMDFDESFMSWGGEWTYCDSELWRRVQGGGGRRIE